MTYIIIIYYTPKKEVVNAISEMLVCTYSDEFIGTTTSTFSNYIQYLRYNEKKSFYFYGNLEYNNTIQCKLTPVVKSQIPWVRYGARGGHPVGWHIFWPPPIKNMVRPRKMTIKGKTDGFGSQYQAIMSLIAYCGCYCIYCQIYRCNVYTKSSPSYYQIQPCVS